MSISEYHLENGLRVILNPELSAPLVTLDLTYHVGSANDPLGKKGHAHLIEHLMFDRSRHLEKGDYDRLCTTAGGDNNAWTSNDFTGYWITVPPENVELALWLESDRMIEYSVGDDSLAIQKDVVIAEKRQLIDNVPYGNSDLLMRRLLFSETHPYHHDPIGLEEDVLNASHSGLREFFDAYYVPDNAYLAIAGNFDAERVGSMVRDYFEPVRRHSPESEPSTVSVSHAASPQPRCRVVADPITPLNATFLGWNLPGEGSEEALTLEFLHGVLADGHASRLARELEHNSETASETGIRVEEGLHGTTWSVYAIASSNDIPPEQLEEQLLGQVRAVAEDGITGEEWRRVVNRRLTGLARAMQSATYRAEQLAWYASVWDDPSLLFTEADRIRNVIPEQVVEAARRFLATHDPVCLRYEAAT